MMANQHTLGHTSPFQFRKVDGVWQRRRSGGRWETLRCVEEAAPEPKKRRTDRVTPAVTVRWEWH